MDPTIKAEWVRRLRSGDYRQGRRHLRQGNSYCCLGVLAEMAVEAGVVDRTCNDNPRLRGALYRYDDNTAGLSYKVQHWAEVVGSLPSVNGQPLHELNDAGRSFEYIAGIIERGNP